MPLRMGRNTHFNGDCSTVEYMHHDSSANATDMPVRLEQYLKGRPQGQVDRCLTVAVQMLLACP